MPAVLCFNAQVRGQQERTISKGVSKAEWLQAATDALARGNVSDITIGSLARTLGISKSGFYWHFKNRDELLDELLDYWNHEVTEVITKNSELMALDPKDRLERAAEIIIDNDLVRYEIGIRQWAMNDKRAARAVRLVNRRRLEYGRRTFGEIGFSEDEADVRAMLFICYHAWEALTFPEIPRKRRRELIARRIALLTTKSDR